MKALRSCAAHAIPVALLSWLCVPSPGQKPSLDVPVIVTAAQIYQPLAALRGEERFPKGGQLLMLKDGEAASLVPSFAATVDASVSFDARTVLFAGKKTLADKWAIWETTIADGSIRLVVKSTSDVIRPLYLPDKKLVYARNTDHGFRLEVAQLDGTGAFPLTYMRASAVPDDVLADGRILFEAGFPLGTGVAQGATPEMFLVYSDGSGVESYRCDHGRPRWGGRQLNSGDVVFTHGPTLARFTSPLATEARMPAPQGEFAGAIAEMSSGSWLVSARTSAAAHFALKAWKPGSATMQTILFRNDADLVEPALVAVRNRPKRHPSALHDWDYANLLALDARQSREGSLKVAPSTVRVETMTERGDAIVLGTAPVEADGSFFVKAPADKPIRFSLLDEHGTILRQEHGWFWSRSGEQRICVGCHVGPEHASENRVPAVLLRTTTPVDLTGTERKTSATQATAGGR